VYPFELVFIYSTANTIYPTSFPCFFIFFSSVLTQRQWESGEYQHYLYFYHPEQLSGPDNTSFINLAAVAEEAWHALEILPEGTVAELALSFRETYSIE